MNTIAPSDLIATSNHHLEIAEATVVPFNQVQLANAAATLALAKEQRIANLIELAKMATSREFGALGQASLNELRSTLLVKV